MKIINNENERKLRKEAEILKTRSSKEKSLINVRMTVENE